MDFAPPATSHHNRRLARGPRAGRSTRSRDASPVPSAAPYAPTRAVSQLSVIGCSGCHAGGYGNGSRLRRRRTGSGRFRGPLPERATASDLGGAARAQALRAEHGRGRGHLLSRLSFLIGVQGLDRQIDSAFSERENKTGPNLSGAWGEMLPSRRRSRETEAFRAAPWSKSKLRRDQMTHAARFPIKFERAYALLSRTLFIAPADSYVEIEGGRVSVRMAWAFRATFDRSAIQRTSVLGNWVALTRGVHGWAGRWLVNGAGDGILVITLNPLQRAYVIGFPVKLRELLVSLDDPSALAVALTA